MLIAVLDLHTTPADRLAALAQLDAERDEIRAMPGNLDFRVYADRDGRRGRHRHPRMGRRAVVRGLPLVRARSNAPARCCAR